MTPDANLWSLAVLWPDLIRPLLRLLLFMSGGLLLAFFLEAAHWTRWLARLAGPLVRFARLGESSGAAFSLAFFSPSAANALLSESCRQGKITRREVFFSVLFNSSPAYFVHLPSLAALLLSFLGPRGLVYLAVTFGASLLRTLVTALCARAVLPAPPAVTATAQQARSGESRADLARKIWRRFRRRLLRLVLFTVPVYLLFYVLQKTGGFEELRLYLANRGFLLSWLKPEAVGIVALCLSAELGAALSAAAALTGVLALPEIILALLIGNILSTPIRALRHQLPSYAGYYAPRLALQLVLLGQSARAVSLIALTGLYGWLALPG